jgi:hypothetical protein
MYRFLIRIRRTSLSEWGRLTVPLTFLLLLLPQEEAELVFVRKEDFPHKNELEHFRLEPE